MSDFKIRSFAGSRHPRLIRPGILLLETSHKGISSAQIELSVLRDRMRRGEVSHVELIDMRPGERSNLTDLHVRPETVIDWGPGWPEPR